MALSYIHQLLIVLSKFRGVPGIGNFASIFDRVIKSD